jgi:hypothetical protein
MRLEEFCKATGATHRQIDYWCRNGIPLADRAECKGSGFYRKYYPQVVPRVKLLVRISNTIRSCPVEVLKDAFYEHDIGKVLLGNDLWLVWRPDDRANETPEAGSE